MIQPKIEIHFSELEKSRKALFDHLGGFTYEQLTYKPSSEKWSVIQILHHLVIVEAGTMMYIQKKILAPDKIPHVKTLARIRMLLLKASLLSNFKFKAPAILQSPDNTQSLAEIAAQWEKTRGKFYAMLEGIPSDLTAKGIFRHPLVGRIDAADTLRFIKWHKEHHLKQIYALLK